MPFEPPVASTTMDSADRARLEKAHHPKDGVAPIASVQTELNPAARESLSKLAQLIRSQMRANEKAAEEALEESNRHERDRPGRRPSHVALVKAGEGDQAAIEAIAEFDESCLLQETFPNVVLATERLRTADKKRGIALYGQGKPNVMAELVVQKLEPKALLKAS